MAWISRIGWAMACVLPLAACERDMEDQAKFEPYEAAPLFPNGQAARMPVEGTVPHDDPPAEPVQPQVTLAVLERGRERFDIYCAPCHGRVGDGAGMIVQRGFPQPPSYHDQSLRQAPDRFYFDVIGQGFGRMFSYANRVAPEDRWAIVAYIRALQLSQHATLREVREAGLESRLGAAR
ncbi:c-type cytochrome [Methylomagnum ishizawai]|uniref:c-type cytochrome n=1 Tax=Methylomagnum ishizawai TaxID=1760988 RepID=UPI001C8013D7|nr:cytochrome c [Methylomagnum ishizawai]